MGIALTPVQGDPFAQEPQSKVKLTPVNGDPFAPQPGILDRAKAGLSNVFHKIVDFVESPPAQQIIDRNRAAGRPQPDAFGSVTAAVPKEEHAREALTESGPMRRAAGRGVIPTLAGAGGFGAGFAAGGTLTAPAEAIPVAGPVINLLGALGGGMLAAYGASSAAGTVQDKAIEALPEDVQQLIGQDVATRQADQQQHPMQTFAGDLLPMLLTMRPGLSAAPVAEDAPLLTRILSHPAGGAAVGGTLGGAQEAAREEITGEGLDPEKIAISSAVGAAMNRPTALGSKLFQMGGNAATIGLQRAARGAGYAREAFTGRSDEAARQPFDVEATATEVPPEPTRLLPPPDVPPPSAEPPAPQPVAPEGGPVAPVGGVKIVPVAGNPFVSQPTAAPEGQPVEPQPVPKMEPHQAAPGTELGQTHMGPPPSASAIKGHNADDYVERQAADELPNTAKNWKGGPDAKVHTAQDPDGKFRFAIGYSDGTGGMGAFFSHSPQFNTREEARAAGFAELKQRVPAGEDSKGGHYPESALKRQQRIHQWIDENSAPPPAPAAEPTPQPASAAEPQALQEGEKHVRTPAGNKVRTRMEVVDASTLNKATGELQNRDRSRDTTALQVQDIISKFDPELLGDDPSSDRGAPIVHSDNTVLSGNGRMLALNEIYANHPEKADAYRRFIEAQGHSTEGVERPVLIRRVTQDMTPEEARQFVVESNKDNKLELSPVERARSDADSVTPEMLARYAGGDLNSGANAGFVEEFTKRLTAGEMGNVIGSDRRLTTAGIDRIENAVVAKAYDHPKLLEKLMESSDNEIRSITSSLANVAPAWAKMRAAAKAGEIDGRYDITDDIATAAMRVAEAKRRGEKPADIISQQDAFDRLSPATEAMIRAFYNPAMTRAAGVKPVTQFLQDYIDEANRQTASDGLFGKEEGKAPQDILNELLRQRDGKGEATLFDAPLELPEPKVDVEAELSAIRDRMDKVPHDALEITGDKQTPEGRHVTFQVGADHAGDMIISRDGVADIGIEGEGAGTLGIASVRKLMRQLKERFPEITSFKGERETGARGRFSEGDPRRIQQIALDALDSEEDATSYGSKVQPEGDYKPSFEASSFTDRTSIYNEAAEVLGLDPDKFRLLPAPRQVVLLQRAMMQRFGIRVDVDRGMQERFAIDQMLDAFQTAQGMAHVLSLPSRAISLDGKLTLRLQKKGNFLGAYSPGGETIILPKRSNSFAHEWGHALDYHLLRLTDGDGKGLSGAIRSDGAGVENVDLPSDVRAAFVDLLNSMFFDKAGAAERIMQLEKKIAAAKEGTKSKAQLQAQLQRMKDGNAKPRGIDSAFLKGAKAFDGDGGDYWTAPTEMFARAFEAYTSYSAEASGLGTEFIGKGDAQYLDGAGERFEKTFPKGEERAAIFAAFDRLIGAIAQKELTAPGGAAERPGGTATRITDYDKTPKVERERGIIRREVAAIRNAVNQARKEKASRIANPKGMLERAGDLNGAVFMSMTANLRMIQGRSGSASLQKLIDLLSKQDGRGDRTVARTFHEDVHLTSKRNINRVANILAANKADNLDIEDTRLLRDLLTEAREGTVDVPAGKENLRKAAAGIRHVLDEEWHANQRVGIDLGYTRNGYLSRVLDLPRVWNDQKGFVTDAAKVYGVVFDNAFHNAESVAASEELLPRFLKLAKALSKKGYEVDTGPVRGILKQLSKVDAAITRAKAKGEDTGALEGKMEKLTEELNEAVGELWEPVRSAFSNERAEAWLSRINLVAGEEHNAAAPDSKYTKHRDLPPEADKLMEKFYLQDPVETVVNYLSTSARRTAYAKRFGHDGAKRKALFEGMAREGVSPDDQRTVQRILDTATGRRRSEMPKAVQDTLGVINAAGVMALLPRATLSSLAEPFTAGLVTGSPMDGFGMVARQIGQALGAPSGKVRYELARAMGIVSDLASDGIMEARYGQTWADELRSDRFVSTMFRRTGLTWLTRSQKVAGVGLCHAFLDNLAQQIVRPKGMANDAENAIALMRELGIRDPEAFSRQLLQMGRLPTVEELDSAYGEDYSTAQLRFSDMVIQNPNAMDRPELSQNPAGRVIYGITGFSYGYWRNIIKRNGILLKEKAKRDGPRAALYAGQLAAAAAVAFLMQATISTIRERLLNPKRWHELEQSGDLDSTMAQLAFTRTFSFGGADPIIQSYTGLKYQRDLSNVFIGPGPGFFIQNTQKVLQLSVSNSRKTNTAEYGAVQGVYSAASPFVAFGLARLPGGPMVDVATGVGMAYVTSPAARDAVATAAVGEKNGRMGPDGKKVKSGPTSYDKLLGDMFGEVKRKERKQPPKSY